MKKSLIALGVALSLIGSAYADGNKTAIYGSLGKSFKFADGEVENALSFDKTVADISNNTALVGVDVSEDLGNGMEAFLKFEFGFGDNENNGLGDTRYAYLGLKGDFGTFTFGRQKSVWNHTTKYNDMFNDANFFYHNGVIDKFSKAVSYISPSFSGFNFAAAIVMEEAPGLNAATLTSNSRHVDAFELGGLYNNNGISAGLSYANADSGNDNIELIGGHIGYGTEEFKVGLGAEHVFDGNTVVNLGGEYVTGPNTFRGLVGISDNDDNTPVGLSLGYQYNLSERTYTWVEASYENVDTAGVDDKFSAWVGIRHDF